MILCLDEAVMGCLDCFDINLQGLNTENTRIILSLTYLPHFCFIFTLESEINLFIY